MHWAGNHKAIAQNPISNLSFEQITKKQGLAGSTVTDIFQDSRGFIWAGTSNGASRYDGLHFKNYSATEKGGITDKIITSIAEDANGNIWLATENGLNKLNPTTDKIEQYYEGSGPGTIPYRWCNKIYADKQKNIWLTTEKGLALYHPDNNSFENFPVSVYGKDARINKFITGMLEDSKGRFWLATSYGIKLFDRKTKTYKSYHKEEPAGERLTENIFKSVIEDGKGNILALSAYTGVFRYNPASDKFESTGITRQGLNVFELTDITVLSWQGTEYLFTTALTGLLCINNQLVYDAQTGNSLKFSRHLDGAFARKVFHDRSGNLWVGSEKGLFRCSANGFAFQWIPVENSLPAEKVIYHIIPDVREPQNIYYLSTTHGWYRYNQSAGSITPQSSPAAGKELLNYINAWANDKNGYWFTSMNGFGYYDVNNNRLTDLTSLVTEASGQKTTGFMIKDNEGQLWLTMKRNGILIYDPATRKTQLLFADKKRPDNTYGESIGDLTKGPDGSIYFTAIDKLYKVNPTDFSYKIFPAPAHDKNINPLKARPEKLFFTEAGRLLVSSNLFIYELAHDSLRILSSGKGFLPYNIQNINAASDGSLWIRADEGCFQTDTGFSKWVSYNEIMSTEDQAETYEIYSGRKGTVMVAGRGKLGILKEDLLQKPVVPDAVFISRIKTGENESYLTSGGNHVASYKEAVEIELAATGFLSDKETKMLYMLDGWDKEWKNLHNNPTIRYEQLPPGHYTFKTKAVNAAGMESVETTVRFRIRPPFYFTWWFILLCVAGICTMAVLLYRYRIKKAIQMERLRTRIATDLHDDIGATLSSISMYSEAIKTQLKENNPQLESVLNKMGENSRDMVNSMSDIVWAINPDNDDGEKLLQRIESYAADMCALKKIHLHFTADDKLKTVSIPLEHRKNIYLIFKESVNNAVKYSGAKNIFISLHLKAHELLLTIKDDGAGFDTNTVKKGNGLKNLELRAAEISGTLLVDSSPGKGTVISLICMV
jgi:ligand-binding sensor domain-containing protein/two-component sensor histidine kinase